MGEAPVCVSAGVDWITGVATEPLSALALAAVGHDLFYFEEQRGNIKKGWGMSGFSGFKCGSCELGFRGNEVIVRLMSDLAQNCWRSVYQHSDSVTRIDLQYTLDHKKKVQPMIWKLYRQANRKSAERKNGPQNRITIGNDGGATLYCGSRWSNVFGRIYAKGPQSKDPYFETCARYETQWQRKLGNLVARKIATERVPADAALGSSATFFRNRIANFPRHTAIVRNYSCSRSSSTLQKRLEWLYTHVNPSVKLLVQHGQLKEALRALGLDEYVSINYKKVGRR